VRNERAVVVVSQKSPAWAGEDDVVKLLPQLRLKLMNHSGAEYSFYDGATRGAEYAVEVIWPAAQHQIDRKTPAEYEVLEETPRAYRDAVEPFVAERAAEDGAGWIDAVASLAQERERNLFANDHFVINVDTKWQSHEPLSTDAAVRRAWRGKPWTRDLYLLAIVKDPALRSLRDLTDHHLGLCESMRHELRRVALDVYGIPPSKLRLFFHYAPQFYRLHAHCTRIEQVNPGCEAERAHLLSTVIDNLSRDPRHYQNATIPCKLRKGERLYALLVAHDDDGPQPPS